MARRWRFSLSLSAPTLAADDLRRYAIAGTRALGGLAMGPAIALRTIRCEPDAQLHAAMRGDVEAARGRCQMQLPLQLQLGFRCGFEGARGHAATIVSNPKELDGSCHDFPA